MKKLLLIITLFVLTFNVNSQTIVGVGNGEYVIGYRMSDGTAKIFSQNTITPVLQTYTGLDSIVKMEGAQYTNVLLDQRGKAYTVNANHTTFTTVGNDQFGNEFKDNWFVRGFWENYISIRDVDSSLWYWGIGDRMNYNAGATITAPIRITSPGGRKAVKVETASTATPGSLTKFYVLYSDGTVWQFDRGAGMTSVNITPAGETVVNFGIASFYGIAMVTASNKIYGKDLFDGRYIGMATQTGGITDITSRWTGAGLTFPVKEIASGFEKIHMIDNANNLYGSGSNQMGNVGTGDERPNLKTASGSHGIWGVDFSVNGFMLVMPPVLVAKGVKNIQGGTTLALQTWVQDLNNNWYSWGRNKAFSLGNGTSLGPYNGWGGTGDYAAYPNAKDVTMPKKVTPLTSPYTLVNFNVEDDPPPSVGAGINQYITTASTAMLGRVHQQEFTISSTTWSKLSGPAGGTITTPSSLTTGITDLQNGTYIYQLSATNSNGQTSTNTVDVVVSGLVVSQPVYYVSNAGSDVAVGTSEGTAWQTLSKVNSATLNANDTVKFKRGDVFTGKLVPKLGVTYSAYGTGAKPVISGLTGVAGWTNMGGNIWESATISAVTGTVDVVVKDNAPLARGRTPNTGYYTINSATTTRVANPVVSDNNWTGAEIVTRDKAWIYLRRTITGQTIDTLNFTVSPAYNPANGWGFFFQSSLLTLDTQNEWYFNPSTKKLSMYSTSAPTNISIATADTLVEILGDHNITLKNIAFKGARKWAALIGYSRDVTIDSCEFAFTNEAAIQGQMWGQSSRNLKVINCNFYDNLSNGISIPLEFPNNLISHNTIERTGMINGSIYGSDNQAQAIDARADTSIIQYNKLNLVGYHGIQFDHKDSKVQYNVIDSSCALRDDGGAIYSFDQDFSGTKLIKKNVITNTIGNNEGKLIALGPTQTITAAMGIYMDGCTPYNIIDSNTVVNSGSYGIFIHGGTQNTVTNNTVFNSGDASILLSQQAAANLCGSVMRNTIVKNNIFIATKTPTADFYDNVNLDQNTLRIHSNNKDSLLLIGIIDSNIYARPIQETRTINIHPNGNTQSAGAYSTYNFAEWRTYSGIYDLASTTLYKNIASGSELIILYAENIAKEVTLGNTYKNAKGTSIYSGSVTLQPYTSLVLVQDAATPPVGPNKKIRGIRFKVL